MPAASQSSRRRATKGAAAADAESQAPTPPAPAITPDNKARLVSLLNSVFEKRQSVERMRKDSQELNRQMKEEKRAIMELMATHQLKKCRCASTNIYVSEVKRRSKPGADDVVEAVRQKFGEDVAAAVCDVAAQLAEVRVQELPATRMLKFTKTGDSRKPRQTKRQRVDEDGGGEEDDEAHDAAPAYDQVMSATEDDE